jgi:uncharacterized protein (DUF934 family)
MKKLLHPLCILAIIAFPFVVYSQGRGGGFAHLFEVRLFGTHYLWEVVLLTSVIVFCGICYRRKEKKVFSFASIAAIGAFLALQSLEEYPTDYKLWIYIVAPVFTWSLVFSSAALLAVRLKEAPNQSSQPMPLARHG